MLFVTTAQLVHRYALPRRLAAAIVTDRTRHCLLHGWQAWTLLLAGLGVPLAGLWLHWLPSWDAMRPMPVFYVIVLVNAWRVLGQALAGPAILAEAARKAARLGTREATP